MAFTSINYWKYLREQFPTAHHSLDITRTQYVFVLSELFRENPHSAISEYMKYCNVFTSAMLQTTVIRLRAGT